MNPFVQMKIILMQHSLTLDLFIGAIGAIGSYTLMIVYDWMFMLQTIL